MTLGTQWTGDNLRAKVTRSHMPISVGVRGHTRSAQIDHNDEMSESGNVFRRLGKEADLSYTLNRIRDQERSQHSTAQGR